MAIEKINYLENGLNWQCCFAGSSKTAHRIFSIVMGADYSFEVKKIEIWVPEFFKHNNSSVATVVYLAKQFHCVKANSRTALRNTATLTKNFIFMSSNKTINKATKDYQIMIY